MPDAPKPAVTLRRNMDLIHMLDRCDRAAERASWHRDERETFFREARRKETYEAAVAFVEARFQVEWS